MYIHLTDFVSAGFDGFSSLPDQRRIVCGWLMRPVEAEVRTTVTAGETACHIQHFSHHPRPDVRPTVPGAVAEGFTLVFAVPEGEQAVTLEFAIGELRVVVELPHPSVNTDLIAVTALRDWHVNFDLLEKCVAAQDELPLLNLPGYPRGAFTEWLGKVPSMPARFRDFSWLDNFSAACSPAGEVSLQAMLGRAPEGAAELRFVAIAAERPTRAGPGRISLPGISGRQARQAGARLGAYAQLDVAAERLREVELVVQISCGPDKLWFRCGAEPLDAVSFLESLDHGPESGFPAIGPESFLLPAALAEREAAFRLGPERQDPLGEGGESAPATAVIFNVAGARAVRTLFVAGRLLAGTFRSVVLAGPMAAEAAEGLQQAGLVVVADPDPAVALQDACQGESAVAAFGLDELAEAMITGDMAMLQAQRLSPARLARLLALHRVAGCEPGLVDSLRRMRRAARAEPWFPVPRPWRNPGTGRLINAHLERMWTEAPAQRRL